MKPTLEKDEKYPNMWRIRWEDGTLSDMVNLSRAKDALSKHLETLRKKKDDAGKG